MGGARAAGTGESAGSTDQVALLGPNPLVGAAAAGNQARSQHGHLQGEARRDEPAGPGNKRAREWPDGGEDDEDMFDCESLENPLRPASSSAPVPSHRQKIRVRKDVKNPGSKPRTGGAPPLHYEWKMSQYTDMTEEECERREDQIAEIQCGKNLHLKPFKRPLKYKVRKDGSEVATLSCAFDVECACPWKCRRIRRATSEGYLYAIEFSELQHVDHNIRKQSSHVVQRRHLSKNLKSLIDSPTKLQTKPRQLVAALRKKLDLSADDVPAIVREREKLLK